MRWLYEAKKKYDLMILNYMITSNIYTHWFMIMEDEMLSLNLFNYWQEESDRNIM